MKVSDKKLPDKAALRVQIEHDVNTFEPGILVVPDDLTAHDFWGRSVYPNRRIYHSGECPVFKPGNRWEYTGR